MFDIAILLLLVPLVSAEITNFVDLSKHNDHPTTESTSTEHGGTHIIAPFQFNKQGWHIADIPLERFFGKAAVIDLGKEAAENPDLEVEPKVFEEWEKTNGKLPEGAIVLLNFNWTHKSDDKAEFFGSTDQSDNSTFHYPGLSADAAQWLAERTVFGVGTDAVSIKPGQAKDNKAQEILAEKNIFILEQAALNVTHLPAVGYQILALPMTLRVATLAPCRLIAMP